jgi:hypothetical protein
MRSPEKPKTHVKRRRLPNFESCSVALFASLALGSATGPARSETSASAPRASSCSTAPSAAQGHAKPSRQRIDAGPRQGGWERVNRDAET